MSYAIATIIYGVPLTEEVHNTLEVLGEDADTYFETLYTASGAFTPGYCGVKLGVFDECCDFIHFQQLLDMSKITPERMDEALSKFEALPDPVKEACESIAIYLIWSSS